MKTLFKLTLILLLPFYCKAIGDPKEKYPYSKEKTISKAYYVNDDVMTQISNSYGTIMVQLWDESKVSITTKIKVSGKKESTVIEKLEEVNVDFDATKSLVNAKTIFPSNTSWGWNWGNSNVSYEVNYVVFIPRKGNVTLKNSYGDITIAKLNGTSSIRCSYGDLNIGELLNNTNAISLSYCDNSKIDFVNELRADCQYSHLSIAKAGEIISDGNYNHYKFSNVNNLKISSNYNDILTSNVTNYVCNGNYLDIKATSFSNLSMNTNYSTIYLTPNANAKKIALNTNYSNVKITLPEDFKFDFDIEYNYGSFKTDTELKYSEKSTKNASGQYKGYRKSPSNAKLTYSGNYGSIQLIEKQ